MGVLVDTSVWSLALRRRRHDVNPSELRVVTELQSLIDNRRAKLIGAVRQGILTGVRHPEQFEKLRSYLSAFPDEDSRAADYELAAEFSNACMARGIAGSSIDFLLCAVSASRHWPIFTQDQDFREYERVLPLTLHFRPAVR